LSSFAEQATNPVSISEPKIYLSIFMIYTIRN
jgi:hypothetical protein